MESARIAPKKTANRECFIAMMAAMKKVLSAISEMTITEHEAMNPCKNSISLFEFFTTSLYGCSKK